MENKLKCLKCSTEVDNSILCQKCNDDDLRLGEAMKLQQPPSQEMVVVTQSICSECDEEAEIVQDGMCNICASKVDEDDFINFPKHYNTCSIQPIDVIEDWKLDFRLANSVKYIQRHLHKGSAKKDLEKAIWYIQRYIDKELNKDVKND